MDMYCDCGAIVDGVCACMIDAERESLNSWGSLADLIRGVNG
jgi:hypothetical protein